MMELVSIFTKNLRHYLKEHEERGRTFTDICREAPFPKGTLGTLTSGRVDNPTYNTAYKLAQALWVPMEAFAVTTKAERETYCKTIRARHKENRLIQDIYAKADERKKQ
jgi:transcriptional regulator with XRE-family HTH domain